MPDRTLTTLLSAKLGGAAGFGLAAGLCYILAHATEQNRLSSDTYKRLNVGLLGFFLVGLLAIPGEAAFAHQASSALALTGLLTLLRACGAAVSFAGWKRGVVGSDKGGTVNPPLKTLQLLVTDLFRGTRETLMGILRVQNKKKALTYRNSLLLIAACMFSSFMEGLFDIQVSTLFERERYRTPHSHGTTLIPSLRLFVCSFISPSAAAVANIFTPVQGTVLAHMV